MSTASNRVSACSRCHYYQVEGRRGGHCQQLGVPVQAAWKPCPLVAPIFNSMLPTELTSEFSELVSRCATSGDGRSPGLEERVSAPELPYPMLPLPVVVAVELGVEPLRQHPLSA